LREDHFRLNDRYNKLADTWNAFQAINKPRTDHVYRAEIAGEVARKLASTLVALCYETGSLREVAEALLRVHDQQGEVVDVNAPKRLR